MHPRHRGRRHPQFAVVRPPRARGCRSGCGAGQFGAQRAGQPGAVDDERRARADQQLLLARRQRDRLAAGTACAAIGPPSSRAPTVVCTEVCTNRPATAMIGPRAARDGDARGSGCVRHRRRDRVAVGVQRHHLGQARRLELVEAQCGAVDDVVPVQQADSLIVSVTRGCQRQVSACPVGFGRREPAGRRRGRRPPASDGRAAPTSWGSAAARRPRWAAGSVSVRLGGDPVLHDALRRGPRGARVAVGGGVRRAQHVDRIGVADGARGARLRDQVGQRRALPRRAPTPSASPTSVPARSASGSG